MNKFNPKIGVIHFIGIGGIGMSGIAEVMHSLNYKISGSDLSLNANTQRLEELGIQIIIGHNSDNIKDASVVVVSSAIETINVEVEEARRKRIPIVKRAEMLAELMRFKNTIAVGGTHGKTTTTSLISAILDKANMDPTVINGGIINSYGSNARLGTGDWMTVEADESDGSFLRLPSTIVVVTNIDPEHLDYYGSYKRLKEAFKSFIENIPFYGFAVMCADDSAIQNLMTEITERRIITYGFSHQADIRAVNLEITEHGTKFNLEVSPRIDAPMNIIEGLYSTIPGRHNVQNVLAACAISLELGISSDNMKKALKEFQGVRRRFSNLGVYKGIKIIDDYGHHPMEIKSALLAAREITPGRVIAIIQPHRYSRLRDLFEDFTTSFNDADIVFVTDVYAAGENPIKNINKENLVRSIRSSGHKDVRPCNNLEEFINFSSKNTLPKDTIIFLGAGSITNWASDLVDYYKEKGLSDYV